MSQSAAQMLDRHFFALQAVQVSLCFIHFITQAEADMLPGEIGNIAAKRDTGFEIFDILLLVVAVHPTHAVQPVSPPPFKPALQRGRLVSFAFFSLGAGFKG